VRNSLALCLLALLVFASLAAIRPSPVRAGTVEAVAQLQAFLSQCDVVVTGTVRKIQVVRELPPTVICSPSSVTSVNYDHAIVIAVDSVRLGRGGVPQVTLFYTAGLATPLLKLNDRVLAGGVYKSNDHSQLFGSFTTQREMALGPRAWLRSHPYPWTPVYLDTLASQVARDSALHPSTMLRRTARLGLYRVRTIQPCVDGHATCSVTTLDYPNTVRGPDIYNLVLGCDRWCPLDVVVGDTLVVPVTSDADQISRVELPGCARSYKVQCGTLPVMGEDLPAALRVGQPQH